MAHLIHKAYHDQIVEELKAERDRLAEEVEKKHLIACNWIDRCQIAEEEVERLRDHVWGQAVCPYCFSDEVSMFSKIKEGVAVPCYECGSCGRLEEGK